MLNRTASITALYVESFVQPLLDSLATQPGLGQAEFAALDRLVTDTPLGERIVAFRVWSPRGEVLYSPDRARVGRMYPVKEHLARALQGEVVADVSDLTAPENETERQHWRRLVEVYVPVREAGGSRILAVTEFYQLPDELDRATAAALWRSWAVVAAGALVSYLALAGVVRRGSDTIAQQQAGLRLQITALSRLLEQNDRLTERLRHAAGRTTALNEQALRRISADLHDGPGQALALALLRLDALRERFVQVAGPGGAGPRSGGHAPVPRDRRAPPAGQDDFATVHGAVRDALSELRAISAGLRSPELEPLSVAEVVQRAVRDHERRTAAAVRVQAQSLPEHAPLAVKIALFRSLQEALSNAARHASGAGVAVRVWAEKEWVCLEVSDSGPGFPPDQPVDAGGSAGRRPNGGLGLAGMRERAELLDGTFELASTPGEGSSVRVCWPLGDGGAAAQAEQTPEASRA